MIQPIVRRFVGRVLFRPWWDTLGVPLVTNVFLPLSRAWAAAREAEGDAERFAAAIDRARAPKGITGGLNAVKRLDKAYVASERAWEEAFFGAAGGSVDDLATIARARDRAAFRLMLTRTSFLPFLRQIPAMRWEISGPADVGLEHGARLAFPDGAFPVPAMPKIAVSRPLVRGSRRRYWLHFLSPVLADNAWAEVIEPAASIPLATLLFLHGICVDEDMWPSPGDPFGYLADAGLRVIRPIGPWHGRRMLEGYYGGEPIIGRGVGGLLTGFQAWLAELAVLIRWSRAEGSVTVAVAGVSFGSLTSQLAATASWAWPEDMRPDIAFLVATSGAIRDVAFNGSLARNLGLPARLHEAGWNPQSVARWLPLLEPHQRPVMPPERIVMVLGRADDLTPFPGGQALAERWKVPKENLFVRPQGHFSVALGLLSDPSPVVRTLEIIREQATGQR